ncbi:MAG: adenosylcobalamin-dependent ribonucleoside-diphosphate reductase [Nanoarchaeota archaeon]
MYSYDEVFNESLKYFGGDELAAKVFVDKYALRDGDGNYLENNPEMMLKRLAIEFARIEKNKFKNSLSEDEIFYYLDRFKYIVAAGSPLFGIGNNHQVISLSNCFVVETPLDSYSSILKADEQFANICKRRGGVGICLDNLRPAGSPTKNAAKTSTGLLPFMERFSNTIKEVGQSSRRGASMQLLSVHHPQIMDFATVKNDDTKVTGSNISVKLSDEFMKAVKEDSEYEIRFPVDYKEKKINPIISKMIKARDVWNTIIHSAWLRAEPGLLFWDNITNNTPADCYDEYASRATNPCSELNLSELDSCRLISKNVFSYVVNPFTKDAYFDFDKFYEYSRIAQRLMDDLVDLESEKIDAIISKIESDPEPDYIKYNELRTWKIIKKHNDEGRRTGLGMLGIADTLAALGIKYGTDESIEIVEKITRTLKLAAYRESVEMAKELGAFNDYDSKKEENNPFIQRIAQEDPELYADMIKYGRRNISLTTVAPTGSISIEAQTSSGLEPLFNISFTRRKKINDGENEKVDFVDQEGVKWQHFEVFHPKVKMWMKITGETDVTKSPWFDCTADKIDWINRVKLQGSIQKHICHSISSTLNLPKDVTEEKVAEIYKTAWEEGLKGITVYRDGCRSGVLVNKEQLDGDRNAAKRPKELHCEIYHTNVSKKLDKIRHFKYMVMIGILDGEPYEIFAIENGQYKETSGKLVRCKRGHYDLVFNSGEVIKDFTRETTENEDALTRMVSTALRHKVPIHFICEQLNKVEGEMFCFAKSLARSLKKFIKDGTKSSESCPECGTKLIYENGCFGCKNCGWQKCS